MLYTAAPLLDAIIRESFDPRQTTHHRPVATYWNGWTHPSAEESPFARDVGRSPRAAGELFRRLVSAGILATPLVAMVGWILTR